MNMTPTLVVNPTFILRGVNPMDIIKKYDNGCFQESMIPSSKVNIESSSLLGPERGTTPDAPIFVRKERGSNQHVIANSNHELTNASKGSDNTVLPIIGRCRNCGKKIKTPPIGIPTRMDFDTNTGKKTYHVEGNYHSFECMYYALKQRTNTHISFRHPVYTSSECLALSLFEDLFPGEKLHPSNDPDLLKFYGGGLSRNDWESDMHNYVATSGTYVIPIKRQFLQIKRS